MRPETGSNRLAKSKKMSIQLSLDGHTFSARALSDSFPGEEPVAVELLTPRTTLVPAELFDESRAEELLAACGKAAKVGERVVCSDRQAEVVAVMAADAAVLQQVAEKLGSRAHYTTPLLRVPEQPNHTVWICRMAGLLYIKVYEASLVLAEVLPVATESEIVYLFERLRAAFPLDKYRLQIGGEEQKRMAKLFDNHFREVVCE